MKNQDFSKTYCCHCGVEIPKNAKSNFCNICVKLKHCKSCSILLRTKKIVDELKKVREDYKYEPNTSPVNNKFCIDCLSENNLKKKIKEFCSCGCIITEDVNKLDYFIKNGNFCKHCLEKVRQNLS